MSISALALAALGLTANADTVCDLADGLSIQPVNFQIETQACLEGAERAGLDTVFTNDLRQMFQTTRSGSGEEALENMTSLNQAAFIHAYDMAVRGYIDHADPEGREHLERVRLLEPQILIGAFGANVAVLDEAATPEDAYQALMSDPINAENVTRGVFDRMGLAALKSGNRIYVVQLFAEAQGRLEVPLSADINHHKTVNAVF